MRTVYREACTKALAPRAKVFTCMGQRIGESTDKSAAHAAGAPRSTRFDSGD